MFANMTKYFLILILCFNGYVAFCQIDTSRCDIIVINRQSLNDSLTPPIFIKGDEHLIATIKKYFSFTDPIKVHKNESYFIGFNITIDSLGKIYKSVIWTHHPISNKFQENFSEFLKEIDCWLPAYQKGTKITNNNYRVRFFIDIFSRRLEIALYNADNQLLNKLAASRPLGQ
jgi:hypothetical protein